MMCTGSSCEGEVSPKSLSEATAEESALSVPKFGAATGQPDTRQKQVRPVYMDSQCNRKQYKQINAKLQL